MTDAGGDLVARLRWAAAAVEAAQLPSELRSAAFVLAYRDGASADGGTPFVAPEDASPTTRRASPAGLLAENLGVTRLAIDLVFDVTDDDVELIIPRRLLDGSLRTAMSQVIQLSVAARQGAGLESWTEVSVARRACDRMGVLDSHFSHVLASLQGKGVRVRGNSRAREIAISAEGLARAGATVDELAAKLS